MTTRHHQQILLLGQERGQQIFSIWGVPGNPSTFNLRNGADYDFATPPVQIIAVVKAFDLQDATEHFRDFLLEEADLRAPPLDFGRGTLSFKCFGPPGAAPTCIVISGQAYLDSADIHRWTIHADTQEAALLLYHAMIGQSEYGYNTDGSMVAADADSIDDPFGFGNAL